MRYTELSHGFRFSEKDFNQKLRIYQEKVTMVFNYTGFDCISKTNREKLSYKNFL